MGSKTGIEWTDATWNPIIGCSRVSEGCRNCYAEGIAARFGGGKETVYRGLTKIVNGRPVWSGEIKETRQLLQPLSWRSPKRVFVNSMSDLFHENVSDELRDKIFGVMTLCPQHTFQVLTKRPERMLVYLTRGGYATLNLIYSAAGRIQELRRAAGFKNALNPDVPAWPLPNVWLGVSVENQAAVDERIPLLLQTPAAIRFISAEPLLGPIDLCNLPSASGIGRYLDSLSNAGVDSGALIPNKLDWVICGGESGPHARPMHPDWARNLREQCEAAPVPFFFKQWGEWTEIDGGPPNRVFDVDRAHAPIDATNCVISLKGHRPNCQAAMNDGEIYRWMSRMGKKAAGALLDGVEHKAFPEARR